MTAFLLLFVYIVIYEFIIVFVNFEFVLSPSILIPHPFLQPAPHPTIFGMVVRGGLSCRLKPTRFVARWRSLRRRQPQSELCSVSHTSPPFFYRLYKKKTRKQNLKFFFTFPSHVLSSKTFSLIVFSCAVIIKAEFRH